MTVSNLVAGPTVSISGKGRKAWFREPYVWLIIGGPLVVILASIVTIYLAVKNPDPVLKPQPPVKIDAQALDNLTPEQKTALELSVLPANKARNHVVSPSLPKDE